MNIEDIIWRAAEIHSEGTGWKKTLGQLKREFSSVPNELIHDGWEKAKGVPQPSAVIPVLYETAPVDTRNKMSAAPRVVSEPTIEAAISERAVEIHTAASIGWRETLSMLKAEFPYVPQGIVYNVWQKARASKTARIDARPSVRETVEYDPKSTRPDESWLGLALLVGELRELWYKADRTGDLVELSNLGQWSAKRHTYLLDKPAVEDFLRFQNLNPERVLQDMRDRGILLGDTAHVTKLVSIDGRKRRYLVLPDSYVVRRRSDSLSSALRQRFGRKLG